MPASAVFYDCVIADLALAEVRYSREESILIEQKACIL